SARPGYETHDIAGAVGWAKALPCRFHARDHGGAVPTVSPPNTLIDGGHAAACGGCYAHPTRHCTFHHRGPHAKRHRSFACLRRERRSNVKPKSTA
ncbi:hypothetical protein, partial [Bradyrhizobium sp.]|uniref:hypothetical protein n=1 Tax=Bradyrhizobium sp. TaxID=376 RepID=UPI00290443AB